MYYYTPGNKKLRSKKEINKFLVTIKHKELDATWTVTLCIRPIGFKDKNKELIRHSKRKETREIYIFFKIIIENCLILFCIYYNFF